MSQSPALPIYQKTMRESVTGLEMCGTRHIKRQGGRKGGVSHMTILGSNVEGTEKRVGKLIF
jgi:hypothetical protein